MDKKEIIKTIRDLLDTPEHSNKIDAVWDKGFELLRLLEAEQLILNGVGSCLPTSNDRILELKEAIIRWDLKNEINDRQAFNCGWNNCYRWIKDFVRQQR